MTLQAYLDSLKEKTVAVIGIGVSNTPLIRLLAESGVSVTACDRKERSQLGELPEQMESMGVKLHLGEEYLKGLQADVIFRTPGLRPDVPELAEAAARGSVITSEMEVFFQVCPCALVGVTGSDGKTTTTTIIAGLLQQAGHTVHVGGNIGHPLLAEAGSMSPQDFAVLELSSFQLMTMDRSPHIAVVTNLAPNHLDMHKDMAEYVAAKENIFLHQKAGDIAVFNADNAITAEQSQRAPGQVRRFSRQGEVEEGVFLRGDTIVARYGGKERQVLCTKDIRIPGVHNVENYMAAIAAVEGLVPDEVIRNYAKTFNGVEHRIELVRTLKGVRYYNDSIASSPSRTIAGLKSFDQKVILIAGGKDKGISYAPLGPVLNQHVKLLILCGATAGVIRQAALEAENYDGLEIVEVPDYQAAVSLAHDRAVAGDVVILSPASTSFDRFRNFMERGQVFKSIVMELPE